MKIEIMKDEEIIEKYLKTQIRQQLKNKMYEISCSEDLIADTLACLESEEKMKKMLDALNIGIKSEQDILLCCLYIDRNLDIEYKNSINMYLG